MTALLINVKPDWDDRRRNNAEPVASDCVLPSE
jgi:hypothetical protein